MTEAVRCLMAISKGAAPLLSARPGLEVTLRLEIAHLLIAYPHPHALPHAKAHLDRALLLMREGCAGPEEEVRALRHVAIVSQRKATTGDAHVNRNAAKHTLHLALDVAERVGLEWRLYFLLELAKLAWEEHNLAQALKYIAQAKQIATQADQPHFLALFILVETYLAFARRDIGAVVQHLQQYKQTHDAFAQGQNETWVSLQVMYDILSLEHCFVEGDVPRAKAHAKSICAYVQGVNAKGVVVRSFFKWCDASMLGAYYYYAGGAVDRISVPSRAITFFKEGRSRIDVLLGRDRMYTVVLRDGQAMIEILKTKDREVMSLLRLKFALLEQLFLAHLTQSDYAQAVQVLWDMLDMNCAWADRNPEWPSTAHLLAGHLATVCLPEQAATHYIVASQILQQQQQWDTAVIADLFACLALLRASAFKKVDEGLRKCWKKVEASPRPVQAFGLLVRGLLNLHSSQSASAREVLARVLKLGLENPQMTAQVYNAIAESILQDTKNVGAARQSLQLAHKSSSALRDLPSLITALRLSNHVCAHAMAAGGGDAVEQEQRAVAGQLRQANADFAGRVRDAVSLPQSVLITRLLEPPS